MSRVTVSQMIQVLRSFGVKADSQAHRIPEEILASIRRWVIITGTIDKGNLYVGFGINEVATNVGHNFLIETDAGYEGFTEFDRPAYKTAGRHYFQQGIEHANLEKIFDEITFAAFE